MFSHTYEIRYGDYKNFSQLKTGSLLDMMQDVAIKDSLNCGYGIHKLKEMGLAWLLQGINVELLGFLSVDYPIEISTGVKTLKGATSVRCYIVSQNGKVVAKAVANWFLFDTAKQKIAPVLPEMSLAYNFCDFDEECFNYKKLKLRETEKSLYNVRVSNQHIDTNMHLNNQKGADLLMDGLPYDFSFKKINILYKKPAYLGEELYLGLCETDNGYYVHLSDASGEVCLAGVFENK